MTARVRARRAPRGISAALRHAFVAWSRPTAVATIAFAALATELPAQNPFASRVIAVDDQGRAGGGIFNPPNLLGRPDGTVNSLGIGGHVVLGFDVTIVDGPGADLIVTENPFSTGPVGHSFAEVAFVDVSSDGIHFARVPSAYYGPNQSPGPFGNVNIGWYEGLAGATPANLQASDPLDVVEAGGDAIDLSDLKAHPLVMSGLVRLNAISEVRLVDARDGVDQDVRGTTIQDAGSGSADIDAVAVIHHTQNLSARAPLVDVRVPMDGSAEIRVSDPDGLVDLDPQTLRAALWGMPIRFADLLPVMRVVQADATSFTLKLIGPLPQGMPLRVSVSGKDRAGNRSGDARSRPLN